MYLNVNIVLKNQEQKDEEIIFGTEL